MHSSASPYQEKNDCNCLQWAVRLSYLSPKIFHEYILTQTTNATVPVFGNIVMLAHALAKLFSKMNYPLIKRHTEYRFQLSISRAPGSTPFYRGRVSL